MIRKDTSLCFSGHRTERLPQTKSELENLKESLYQQIDNEIKNGIDTFYFGGCYGFDLMCAEIVLERKKIIEFFCPKFIKLIAVIPHEEQAKNWSEDDRELYYNILAQCDDVITLYTRFCNGCYYERNRYMVDKSSKMICYYNGEKGGGTEYTVSYAKKNNLEIINLYKSKKH